MPRTVFVSYSHRDGPWVWDTLVPCLRAAGVDVRIDIERFRVGRGLLGQMDDEQDGADSSLLVLSRAYLNSDYCRHEMERALERDPALTEGRVMPVLREDDLSLPEQLAAGDPLCVDLRRDRRPEAAASWGQLLAACDAELGMSATHWLRARTQLRSSFVEHHSSVNRVVDPGVPWRPLLDELPREALGDVDLERGATASRRGLIQEIVRGCGWHDEVPAAPEDLGVLDEVLMARTWTRLVLRHFDMVGHRDYGVDFFGAIRNLAMDERKLILLVQSRTPVELLLPREHPLSALVLTLVELRRAP